MRRLFVNLHTPAYNQISQLTDCYCKMRKEYEDDDGRTIADMSGVDNNSVLSGILTGLAVSKNRKEKRASGSQIDAHGQDNNYLQEDFDKEHRKYYIFGALGSGLLIGAVYLAGFGLLILILLLIWHH